MSTESIISELAMQARAVKRLPHWRICMEWMTITCTCLVVIGLAFGVREDIHVKLSETIFLIEIFFNFMLILIAGCCSTAFCYPDRAKANFLLPMLVILMLMYSILTFVLALSSPNFTSEFIHAAPHGIRCLACISAFAAIPALWMLWRLRQLASVRPMLAGGAALLMAVATGCLGVRLVETEIESASMIVWHYLPLILFSIIGLALGKRIFKW